jgi:hypothetical protein
MATGWSTLGKSLTSVSLNQKSADTQTTQLNPVFNAAIFTTENLQPDNFRRLLIRANENCGSPKNDASAAKQV